MPKALKGRTLEQFLAQRSWRCAVAAVGLPAYPRGPTAAPSLQKLHDCMMKVRQSVSSAAVCEQCSSL